MIPAPDTQTETPRTDAALGMTHVAPDYLPVVDLTIQLERELIAMRASHAAELAALKELDDELAEQHERELAQARDAAFSEGVRAGEIMRENDALRAELQAVQRDAERYRWLRSAGWFDDAIMEREHMNELFPETIDRAIDAAMSAGRGQP